MLEMLVRNLLKMGLSVAVATSLVLILLRMESWSLVLHHD